MPLVLVKIFYHILYLKKLNKPEFLYIEEYIITIKLRVLNTNNVNL